MYEKAQETIIRIRPCGIQTINDIRLQTVCYDVWLDRATSIRADDNIDAWRPTVALTLQCQVRRYKYFINMCYRKSICGCGTCFSNSGQNSKASLFWPVKEMWELRFLQAYMKICLFYLRHHAAWYIIIDVSEELVWFLQAYMKICLFYLRHHAAWYIIIDVSEELVWFLHRRTWRFVFFIYGIMRLGI
jgi:hypothetical protein